MDIQVEHVLLLLSTFLDGMLIGLVAGLSGLALFIFLILHGATLCIWNRIGIVVFNVQRLAALVRDVGALLGIAHGYELVAGAVFMAAIWGLGVVAGVVIGRKLRKRLAYTCLAPVLR